MTPDTSQQQAIDTISTLQRRVYLLIGAGGSGKTFTIQHLLEKLWDDPESEIADENTFLAAPTGKAAKVINDAFSSSGFQVENEAKTIHRLLGYNPAMGWEYDEFNKMPAKLVVLDEASMIDSLLLSFVIAALPEDCVLILVGDDAQLPPVAPGSPFTDLIQCGPSDIINRLTTNHRQAAGSLIADGCLKILSGKMPTFGCPGQHTLGGTLEDDLFFSENDDKEDIPSKVVSLCRAWHENRFDYAVLAPQKTGVCGVDALNKYLQEQLNPAKEGKSSIKVGWLTFRTGDKVLQTKNNYELGIFNGFCGVIESIDENDETLVVNFDGEIVEYEKAEHIKQLTLGYAMTVHKSQGSQFQHGVLVCHSSHYYMWSRSLLYTGVSRFRKELFVIGDKKALKRGLSNVVSGERNTFLKLKLKGEI